MILLNKIKLNLFNYIQTLCILPSFSTIALIPLWIIVAIVKTEISVYIGLSIATAITIILFALSCPVALLITKKKYLTIYDDCFILDQKQKQKKINYSDIEKCTYIKCKWYCIPWSYLYKEQAGGSFSIVLTSGEKIVISLLYRDYLKIKNKNIKIEVK